MNIEPLDNKYDFVPKQILTQAQSIQKYESIVRSQEELAVLQSNQHDQSNLKEIEKRIGIECRHVVLGHLQRAGSPTVFDRVLGTRLGIKAADMIDKKRVIVDQVLDGKVTKSESLLLKLLEEYANKEEKG